MDGVIPGADQRAGPAPAPREGVWRDTFLPLVLPPRAARARGSWRQDVARLLREPFSRRARLERQYTAHGLLLAIPAFVFIVVAVTVGLGLSLSFAGMLVGLPLLVVALLGARQLGAAWRGLAARLLDLRVPPPPPLRRQPGVVGWVRAGVTDPVGWRAFGYLVLKLPVAVISAVVASWFLVYGLAYLTFPLWWEMLHQLGVVITVPPWMAWWKQDPVMVAMSVRTLPGALALHYELNQDLRRPGCPSLALPLSLLLRCWTGRYFLTGRLHQALYLIGRNFVLVEFTLGDVIKRSFKTSHNGHDLLLFVG